MRLTLRTLLAWLDDTLPPSQVREIGKQVSATPYARELIERIHRVSRQRRHTVPGATGPEATDPNIVAGYVDNELEPDAVAEYEKKCLTSDVNLAEVASVHQILSLLGQKVHVPNEAKARMYQLVRGRESIPPPRPDGFKPPAPEPVTKPIQSWVAPEPAQRHWIERFGPLAGCLALIAILCWSAYESLSPPPPESTAAGFPGRLPRPPLVEARRSRPQPSVPRRISRRPRRLLPSRRLLPRSRLPARGKARRLRGPAAPKVSPGPVRVVPVGSRGGGRQGGGHPLAVQHREAGMGAHLADGTSLEASDRLICLSPFQARIVVAKAVFHGARGNPPSRGEQDRKRSPGDRAGRRPRPG